MPWSIGDLPEGVEKLSTDAQAAWVKTANEALEEGYDEGAAIAIAWTVAKKVNAGEVADIIYGYVPWRPGKFRAAVGGEFEVEPEDVDDVCYAVNHLYSLGSPTVLMAGYHNLDGKEPYPVGLMPAARVREDGKMAAALIGDPFHMNDVRQGIRKLSIEADRDYSSPAYTGDKVFKYWPTAWAVLPETVQAGIPPGEPLAAGEKNKHVRLCASETAPDRGDLPHGKEAGQMEELKQELEQLKAAQAETAGKVSALETERDELKAKLEAAEKERDKLAKEKADAELAAAEAETANRAKVILAAAVPGTREKMSAKLEAAEGLEAKKVLLDAWEPLMDEQALEGARLQASEQKPKEKEGDEADDILEEAKKIQAAEKCDWSTALQASISKHEKEGE